MTTLLFASHDNNALDDATRRTLTAATQLGASVHILVAGHGALAIAETAAMLDGVEKVLLADDVAYAHSLAEPLAALIVSLAADYDAIFSPATTTGKNVLPRVAAVIDVMQVSEITAILAPDTFVRPIYAGNALQIIRSIDQKKVVTVRTSSFAAALSTTSAAPIERIPGAGDPGLSAFVVETLSHSDRPELGSARVVVSGGRALGSADNFSQFIEPVAIKLGAAIGASRAAVDAGFAPNDWQVGQTGKIVAPELYVAVGISGAIQHLAGMKDSKVIVAINKDEEAPIFQVADYGLVGDLFAILPELAAHLDAAVTPAKD